MTTASLPVEAMTTAEMLSAFAETEITAIDGGFRVKEAGAHQIDVLRMIWSWRIVRTPKASPETYDRHWCYAGTSWVTLVTAVQAALEWDGADGTEPAGWNKNGQTGEWREHGA